jgi:hypothetical protein
MSRNTPIRIPRAAFIAMWNDPTVTTDQIATRFKMHRSSVSDYGQRIGLPPRKRGAKRTVCEATFTALWRADVATTDIAAALGMSRTYTTYLARRLGLPKRQGFRKVISIADYRAAQLREAMAASATADLAAWEEAGMVHGYRDVKRKVA